MTTTRTHRTGVLALAAVGLALALTGPALGEPNTAPATQKKSCTIKIVQAPLPGVVGTLHYPHGSTTSVRTPKDDKTRTYKCNDGRWEETTTITSRPALPTVAVPGLSHGVLQVSRPAPAPVRR